MKAPMTHSLLAIAALSGIYYIVPVKAIQQNFEQREANGVIAQEGMKLCHLLINKQPV